MAQEPEARYQPGVSRDYEGEGITVHWEPALCIHVAACIRSLPGVFDFQARPWVKADAATADEIQDAIERCPTGALAFMRTDGAPQEQPRVPTSIQARRNGPLFVEGDVEMVDGEGTIIRHATRVALCRCGQSQNKPYCDLSHRATGFKG